jgi:SAM-dependent methyltransferase
MTETFLQPVGEFDRHYAAEQLRRSRHPLRRFIKALYLRNILRDVRGSTIDFGCGAGQLLERLPPGSAGLEVNQYLIEELRKSGLTVCQARGELRDFELTDFATGRFRTLVIAHVLEHLSDPAVALRVLLAACRRLGIERVVVVVPGAKGYASDRTHKTFIDRIYLETHTPQISEGFVRSSISYFPVPWGWVGRYFIFHEMKVIYDRVIELG